MTENKLKPEDSMWIIKHRPKKISGMVGDFKEKILKYLENPQSTPHFLFYSKTPGTGKCITKDSYFFTNNGITSFEDYIKNNNISKTKLLKENILDVNNNFVETKYFYKGKSNTIKIETKNGYTIEGTPEHRIKLFNKNDGVIWKRLDSINTNDIIPIHYNTNIFGNNNILDYSNFKQIRKKNDGK